MKVCMSKALDVLDIDCVVEGVIDNLADERCCGVGVHRVRQHSFTVGRVAGKCIAFRVKRLRTSCHKAQAKGNCCHKLHYYKANLI